MAIIVKQYPLGATDGSGAFSRAGIACGAGRIIGIGVAVGTLASTADLTITDTHTGAAIYSKSNIAANLRAQPLALAQGVTGSDLAAAAGPPAVDNQYSPPVCTGQISVVVAQGGDTKTGTLYVVIER